jgi:asparagine synthase (glutamine-hydrolysing)
LSIIDLAASAGQPMSNQDGSVQVSFNGEIYNHLALRRELKAAGYAFRTDHADTEVLVNGYAAWGIDGLLQRLDGMFAFALWDRNGQTLTLVRDRVGVKPLYFSSQEGRLIFASEIKALLAHPAIEADIEPIAMYHYLSFLTTPAPLTMFKGIYKLPAGHYLQVGQDGHFRARRYWDALPGQGIPDEAVAKLSDKAREQFYVDGIRERLESAVEKRMMADVPFGVFLSGGIDSSTNVALMSRHMSRPVDTFTVGFKDHRHLNELDYAERVAKRFKTNHHVVMIDEGDMRGYLDDLIHSQDEPIADWVCIPLYFVSKLARENGNKVIQVGEGADEQFCGYASYMAYLTLYRWLWRPFRRGLPGPGRRAVAGMAKALSRSWRRTQIYADIIDRAARDREHFWSGATVFWDILKDQLVVPGSIAAPEIPAELAESGLWPESYGIADSFNVIRSFRERLDAHAPAADVLNRMAYNEFKLRLPELLLMRVDKIAMSVGLEARVPFLDPKLVEFTMDIPMEWKVKNGNPKYLLKQAVRGILPDDIIDRKKMGFGAPMSQWLRGDFGHMVEQAILGSRLMQRGYFRVDYIQRLLEEHRAQRRDHGIYIWTLFNLTAWFDYWVEGKAKGRDCAA